MANSHWSQFSHRPKFIFVSPVVVTVSALMLFMSQKWHIFLWITLAMWVYIIVFQYFFKMPISYTPNLLRTWLVGKNKKPKNYRDSLEL